MSDQPQNPRAAGEGLYDSTFFEGQANGSISSARRILPLVLIAMPVRSVLDVGCGTGNWLAVCRELGVEDVLGFDGAHVNLSQLAIPADKFRPADLSQGFDAGRRFDLACSLEVAEHLPPGRSQAFVEALCRHADAVLFSAAVPGQGGTNHTNERWQHEWAELFAARGYLCIDLVRPAVWRDRQVEAFYAQNTLLYVRPELLNQHPALRDAFARTRPELLSVVHPSIFKPLSGMDSVLLGEIVRCLPGKLAASVQNRLNKKKIVVPFLAPIDL